MFRPFLLFFIFTPNLKISGLFFIFYFSKYFFAQIVNLGGKFRPKFKQRPNEPKLGMAVGYDV